jgi:hypothetical protein
MRRLLFLLTLALYGFSATDMHEWLQVPQAVMHFLEQHTGEEFHELFHNEHTGAQEHDENDHDPFSEDCHGEFCACSGLVALSPVHSAFHISLAPITTAVGAHVLNVAPCGFAGNVWNPPKA